MEGHSGGSHECSEDRALDFLSPEFCPEQALASSPSKLRLPCPHVQPCDNLDTYASIMRGTVRPPATPAPSGAAQLTEDEIESKCEPAKGQKKIKSVLAVMECECSVGLRGSVPKPYPNTHLLSVYTAPQAGPLALVQCCHSSGGRVRVLVRHCAGVRGECVGTLLAFDKHLNLVSSSLQPHPPLPCLPHCVSDVRGPLWACVQVLGDVREEYRPFCTVSNGGVEPRARRRRKKAKAMAARRRGGGGGGGGGEEQLAGGGGEELAREGRGWVREQLETGGGTTQKQQKQVQSRQLGKLFIRGDNIVLITPFPPPQPP